MQPRRGRGPGPGGGAWGCQSRARRCCRGSLHAVARWLPTLPPAARRPGIPRRLLPCCPGTQVKTAAQPRHSVPSSASLRRAGAPSGLCHSRGSPCRPGAVPRGGTTVFPSPLTPPGSAPASGVSGPHLCNPAWGWSRAPPPGPITQSLGLGTGVPSRFPAPHLSPRRAPRQRAATQRDRGGPESFTLWCGFVDIREMRGDGS